MKEEACTKTPSSAAVSMREEACARGPPPRRSAHKLSKRLQRRLCQKKDLMVEVEVSNVNEPEEKSWEDQDMTDAEATNYRAIVARRTSC